MWGKRRGAAAGRGVQGQARQAYCRLLQLLHLLQALQATPRSAWQLHLNSKCTADRRLLLVAAQACSALLLAGVPCCCHQPVCSPAQVSMPGGDVFVGEA